MTAPHLGLPSKGVLVVEEDADLPRSIAQVFEDEGVRVKATQSGSAALATLRTPEATRPCVIIRDLRMPVIDGQTFRDEQLRDPALAGISAIITGARESLDEDVSLASTHALLKPIGLATLLAAAQAHVDPGAPDTSP